jgi:hypothetical protein
MAEELMGHGKGETTPEYRSQVEKAMKRKLPEFCKTCSNERMSLKRLTPDASSR